MRGTPIGAFWPAARELGLEFAGEVNRGNTDNDFLELIVSFAKIGRGESLRSARNPNAAGD